MSIFPVSTAGIQPLAVPMETPASDEHYWPFPEGPGQVVTNSDWETMAGQWQDSGVVGFPETFGTPSLGNQGLYARRLSNTQLEIQPGVAQIAGHWYELKIPKVLELDITGSLGWDGTLRRDVITLRLERSSNSFRFVQLKAAAGTGGSLVLEKPGEEIPLVQADIHQGVGVNAHPGDRRWFLGTRVRPIMGAFPWFDPEPRNGELGVDHFNNRLVVGRDGEWVSAREVFVNDSDSALTSRVSTLEGKATTLQTSLTSAQNTITSLQGQLTTTRGELDAAEATIGTLQSALNGLQPGPWTNCTIMHSSVTAYNSHTLQVRRQGSIVHMRGVLARTSSSTELGSLLGSQDNLVRVPEGFRPDRAVYMAAGVYNNSASSSSPGATASLGTDGIMRLWVPSNYRSGIYRVEMCFSWMLG